MRRSGLMRVVALLFALVQLALPPFATVADAWQERASGAVAVPHAEGERSDSCVPPHGADCVLCQFLTAFAAPPRVATDAPAAAPPGIAPADTRVALLGALADPAARPRAPPTTA